MGEAIIIMCKIVFLFAIYSSFIKCAEGQIVPSAHLLFLKEAVIDESQFVFTNTYCQLKAISDSEVIVWGYPSITALYNYQTGKLIHTYSFELKNMDSIISNVMQPKFPNRKYMTGQEWIERTKEYPIARVDYFWFNETEIIWSIDFLDPFYKYITDSSGRHLEKVMNIHWTVSLVTTDLKGNIKKIKWFIGYDEPSLGFYLRDGYFYQNNKLYSMYNRDFILNKKFQKYDLSEKFKLVSLKEVNGAFQIDTANSKKFLPFENKIPYRYWSLKMLISNDNKLAGDGVGLFYPQTLQSLNENIYEKLNNRTFNSFEPYNNNTTIIFQTSSMTELNNKRTTTYQLVNYDLKADKIKWEENLGLNTSISQFCFWNNNLIYIKKSDDHYEFVQNRILF